MIQDQAIMTLINQQLINTAKAPTVKGVDTFSINTINMNIKTGFTRTVASNVFTLN